MITQQPLSNTSSISQTVADIVNQYFVALEGETISGLYQLVVEQAEEALLAAVLSHFRYNQVKVAKSLGISRATLRKMIMHYFGAEYCCAKER